MTKSIQRVAVLGAGTMGARIAAHMANAGVPCYLLDIVPPGATGADRNKIAAGGLQAALKSKPAAFFDQSLARLVTVGNFEDDLKLIANADWIIEAVLEDLEIKRNLLRKVEAIRRPGSIVTTNTSGLPVSRIAEGFSQDFRRAWFGTHFFNPPRYLRLPQFFLKMLEQKQLGDKTGGGFYRKPKPGEAKDGDRLALDWHTMEYRPRKKAQFPALEMAKNVEEPGQRVRMLLGLNGAPPQKNDKAGQFLWTT